MKKNLSTLINEGVHFPKRFIEGRTQETGKGTDDLKSGEGAITEIDGKKVAAYKNDKGVLIMLSPVCRHMGCIVAWNSKDKTWDCPCHGSRYEADGTLKQGPANKDLKRLSD